MFGTLGNRTPLQGREMIGVVVVALVALVALVSVFVVTRPGGSGGAGSRAVARQPDFMPAMGSVMPGDVRVSGSARQLTVAIGDYWFKAGNTRLRAGKYSFTARNYGVVRHDVMIERMPIRFSAPGAPIDEAAAYGLDDMEPGMTKSTRVVLTAGRWELFCSLPGHYQSGQHQVVTVVG